MPPTWPLLATLGTYCGAPFNVLCAWLARDGSFAWLFDAEATLSRIDLRAWSARRWRIIDEEAFLESTGFSAQFAAVATSDEPFLWLSFGQRAGDGDERCTVSVYAISERGPQRLREMPFDRKASAGPNRVGAECSAVIVQETRYPGYAHIFKPDGAPLGRRELSVVAATSRGYWEKNGERFEFYSHDGTQLGGAEVPDERAWVALGAVGESTLALESAGELAMIDGERSRCDRAESGLDLGQRAYESWGGSTRAMNVLHKSGALARMRSGPAGSRRAAFGVRAWSSPEATPVPFGENATLQWLDERWALATTRGHCALFDRELGELVQSDCPPVTAIAMGDATQPILVQHEDGLTRWWDASTQRIVAEDRSPLATERTLVGLRCGSTRALFIERPTFGELTLVERTLRDGAAQSAWSTTVRVEEETATVTALGEDELIITLAQPDSKGARAVLLSRDGETPIELAPGEAIVGRLTNDEGQIVLERRVAAESAELEPTLRREHIRRDGTRMTLDARPLPVSALAMATAAGFADIVQKPRAVRLVDREGTTVDHPCRALWGLAALARDVLRVVARTSRYGEVIVIDATRGVIAQWTAIERDDEITALAISDDGATVAVGTASGRVLVYQCPDR